MFEWRVSADYEKKEGREKEEKMNNDKYFSFYWADEKLIMLGNVNKRNFTL